MNSENIEFSIKIFPNKAYININDIVRGLKINTNWRLFCRLDIINRVNENAIHIFSINI